MSDLVSAGAFLKPAERRYIEVEVAGFGRVRLQSLTERERAAYERASYDDKGELQMEALGQRKARLVALCAVDDKGFRILGDREVQKLYENMDSAILDAIYEACAEHVNGGDAVRLEKKRVSSEETAAADLPSS